MASVELLARIVDAELNSYQPPVWAKKFAESFLADGKMTITDRCRKVGIQPEDWWAALQDRQFEEWFNARCEAVCRGSVGVVGLQLLRQALEFGKAPDLKLFMERWDSGYAPTQKVIQAEKENPLIVTLATSDYKATGLVKRANTIRAERKAKPVDAEIVPEKILPQKETPEK